jgi:uncharacterized protein YdhG (YjbR/CyaY superfamily)
MKKTKLAKGGAARVQKTDTVADYLARVPEPARSTLEKVRAVIRSVAPPHATETISYGMPTFQYKGMLASYAAFSGHCSLFPGAGPIIEFEDELKKYKTTKGTIRFAPGTPLPIKLLKQILKSRIRENEEKEIEHKKARRTLPPRR